jgi:hypothetical protein
MVRYIHVELRAAIGAAAALVVTAVVLGVVRGLPDASDRWWWPYVAVACLVALWVPVRASRLKAVGRARTYEAAVPLEEPPAGGDTLHRRPAGLGAFVGFLAVSLPLSLLWDPVVTLFLTWMMLDWLSDALVAARWERRHGVLLWQGIDEDHPWKFAYSRVSPPPPTRTATDVPPA